MSYRTDVDRLFAKLADTVGDPDLALNAEGAAYTTLNDIPFSFHFSDQSSTLFIQVYCRDLKNAQDQESVLVKALKANYLWSGTYGGVLGVSGDDLTLSYRLEFPLSDEQVPDDFLVQLLPHLAGVAEWAEELV